MKEKRSVGQQLIVIAAIYMMAALVLGFVMGLVAREDKASPVVLNPRA